MTVQRSISVGDAKSNASNKNPLSEIYDTLLHIQQNAPETLVCKVHTEKSGGHNDRYIT